MLIGTNLADPDGHAVGHADYAIRSWHVDKHAHLFLTTATLLFSQYVSVFPLRHAQDSGLSARNVEPWLFSSDDSSAAPAALLTAAKTVASADIEWLPMFGCALMVLNSPQPSPRPGHCSLLFVGLDSWEFRLHSYRSGSLPPTVQPIACCCGSSTVLCDSIPATDFQCSLLPALRASIAAHEKTQKGFQRTPAFVMAKVQQALMHSKDSAAFLPRGGFTDVGLHTGGVARDTCWPLVREVFKVSRILGLALVCYPCVPHRMV